MDALIELLPLLFIGAYYLLAGRRKARLKKEAAQRQALAEAGEAPPPKDQTPFQAFLEQMEEAVAEAENAQEPERTDEPKTPELKEIPLAPLEKLPDSVFSTAEFHAPTGSFESSAPVDHEQHGFGQDNPLSEEVFEQAPTFTSRTRPDSGRYDPHGLRRAPEYRTEKWHSRLRDADAARDAFVLQTIFGPRGGLKGR